MSLSQSMQSHSHQISLTQAIDLVTRYRQQLPQLTGPGYEESLPYAELFRKDVFETLLAVSGAVGIRGYLGMDAGKQVKMIFVAVNDQNEDILPGEQEEGAIFDYGQRCPPICATGPLNPPA